MFLTELSAAPDGLFLRLVDIGLTATRAGSAVCELFAGGLSVLGSAREKYHLLLSYRAKFCQPHTFIIPGVALASLDVEP